MYEAAAAGSNIHGKSGERYTRDKKRKHVLNLLEWHDASSNPCLSLQRTFFVALMYAVLKPCCFAAIFMCIRCIPRYMFETIQNTIQFNYRNTVGRRGVHIKLPWCSTAGSLANTYKPSYNRCVVVISFVCVLCPNIQMQTMFLVVICIGIHNILKLQGL